MWRSCLVLLAVFAGAFLLEKSALDRRAMPAAWLPALALAAGVTLTLGSLQGLVEAWRTRSAPSADPADLRDGQTVRLGGVLRAEGRPLRAPFSGRDAVLVWYNATAQHWREANSRSRPSFRGIALAPSYVETSSGRVALTGVPNLREIPEQQFSSPADLARAASHVARTDWNPAPDIWTASADHAQAVFEGGPGDLPANLMNLLAREMLDLDRSPNDEEQIRRRLAEQNWLLRERVLPPGTEATVVGTFRANPPRVDVGYGPGAAGNAITPGAPAATAARSFSTAAIFVLAMALLTAAGHYLVFGENGALYRNAIERIVER